MTIANLVKLSHTPITQSSRFWSMYLISVTETHSGIVNFGQQDLRGFHHPDSTYSPAVLTELLVFETCLGLGIITVMVLKSAYIFGSCLQSYVICYYWVLGLKCSKLIGYLTKLKTVDYSKLR